VLQALSRMPIGHLDPLYVELMGEVQALLRYAWQTDNRLTIPMSGTGSAAMEATLANTIEPGDKVLVAITSTGFAAADASNPNIVGVTLTSSAGANAAAYVANSFGNLVNITKTGNVSVGQVVYLAANGTISATAPSTAGQTIMRVGYVVARAGQAAPTVYFAPQFVAKVL
jgi:hypothetical protein